MCPCPQREPSLLDKGLAASGAALISAVVVNPFDVVKARCTAQAVERSD